MFIRLIIYIVFIYWAVKLINQLIGSKPKDDQVKGSPDAKKPLDLSRYDIEDADYEDIEK